MPIEHKAGDSFTLVCGPLTMTTPSGQLTDFTGWTGSSQVRTREGDLVADLSFAWSDATTGMFAVSSSGSTANWPEGICEMDIQFVSPSGDDTVSTATELVKISRDITQ